MALDAIIWCVPELLLYQFDRTERKLCEECGINTSIFKLYFNYNSLPCEITICNFIHTFLNWGSFTSLWNNLQLTNQWKSLNLWTSNSLQAVWTQPDMGLFQQPSRKSSACNNLHFHVYTFANYSNHSKIIISACTNNRPFALRRSALMYYVIFHKWVWVVFANTQKG